MRMSRHPAHHHLRARRFIHFRAPRRRGWLAFLGPGLITGASDDDPSGIATYSQAGAKFGFTLLWPMLFTIPLMAAFQEICARIGRVTGRGLARNMRLNYPAAVVYPLILVLVLANTLNLAADINAMGDALSLIIGGPRLLYSVLFAIGSLSLQVFWSYARYTRLLKWLALILLVYVACTFVLHVNWGHALKATI